MKLLTTHAMSVKEVADLKLATRRYKRARAQRRYHKKNAVAAGTSYGKHVTHAFNYTPLATTKPRAFTPSFTPRASCCAPQATSSALCLEMAVFWCTSMDMLC